MMDCNQAFLVDGTFYHVCARQCDEGGWTAQCEELPAAIAQADSLDELSDNILDAIRRVLAFREGLL